MAPNPEEKIEWSQPRELAGVNVILGTRATSPWRVYHETYSIATLLDASRGSVEWTYRNKVYTAVAGEIGLMQPGEVHADTRPTPPSDFRVLLLPAPLVTEAAIELGSPRSQPNLKSGHCSDPRLFRALARLHVSLESECSPLERQSYFVACLRMLLEHCSEGGIVSSDAGPRASLLRARDFIREHFSRAVGLEELAAVSELSRFHLVRAFTHAFGLPPHAYQISIQIAKARSLLSAGARPAEVAAETGFADQSHLTRHFRALFHTTPGEYRRACGFDLKRDSKNVLGSLSLRP
jgi:AraC-like DNA-binding protein